VLDFSASLDYKKLMFATVQSFKCCPQMQTPVAVLFCRLLENTNNNNLCLFVTRCLKCWMVCLVLTASRRSSFRQLLLSCCGRRDDAESDTSAAYTASAAAAATFERESCSPPAIQPVDRMYTSLEYSNIIVVVFAQDSNKNCQLPN